MNKYSHIGQYYYINNCLGSFYRGILDWFGDAFYPRIKYKVIGTYDKSVEFFNKKCELGREVDTNILPSLTLDPSYDFQPEERGGRFLWQYQWLAPGLGEKLFDQYHVGLDDQCIRFVPVFTRYQGTFELIWWLGSVYELLDFRTYLFQFSGGYNRIMRPKCFESFIILPQDLIDMKDGNGNSIDWSSSQLTLRKITNMNQDCYTMPILLNPWFKFTSINDATEKYGGDGVAEYKLSVTVDYEIELPTYMSITPHSCLEKINLNFMADASYSRYGLNPIYDETTQTFKRNPKNPLNVPNLNGIGDTDEPNILLNTMKERAYYKFTQADEDNYEEDTWFSIDNPFDTNMTERNIIVTTYTGLLEYGVGWQFKNNRTQIEVKLAPKQDEIVEFYLYL